MEPRLVQRKVLAAILSTQLDSVTAAISRPFLLLFSHISIIISYQQLDAAVSCGNTNTKQHII